jgi:hypothetical protein
LFNQKILNQRFLKKYLGDKLLGYWVGKIQLMKGKKVVCLAKKIHYKITITCVKISTQICNVCGHTCLQSASCLQWLKFMCGRDSQILGLDSIIIVSFLAPYFGNAPKLKLTLQKMLWILKKT